MESVNVEYQNSYVKLANLRILLITRYTVRTPNALATPATVRSDGSGPTPPYMKTYSNSSSITAMLRLSYKAKRY